MARFYRVTYSDGITPDHLARADYHDQNVAARVAEAVKKRGCEVQIKAIWA
jgi:hypothetical protein